MYDSCQPDQLGSATSSVQMFDPETNMWSRLADMKESRAYVGVTCHNGYLYAIGGEDDNRRSVKSPKSFRFGEEIAVLKHCCSSKSRLKKLIPVPPKPQIIPNYWYAFSHCL